MIERRARPREVRSRRDDRRSPEAIEYRRLYKTARWQAIRQAHLAAEPLCRMCKAAGRVTPAVVCDHVEPHRGDPVRFWNGPFQSLCAAHHDGPKQREERLGFTPGVDAAGRPIGADHPWNR